MSSSSTTPDQLRTPARRRSPTRAPTQRRAPDAAQPAPRPTPLRLLITTDAVGGVWDYTASLARVLWSRGVEVFVGVLGTPRRAHLASLGPQIPWSAAPFHLDWMPGGVEDVRTAREWVRWLAQEWRADVVHVNQLALAGDLGRPTLVVSHGDPFSWWREVHGNTPPDAWTRFGDLVAESLLHTDLLVAPTRYQSELLGSSYARRADRVIHNGVAIPEPPAEGRPRRWLPPGARQTNGPVRDPHRIVTVGRAWDLAKGMDVVEQALALLGHDAPDAHLVGEIHGPAGERFEPRRLRAEGRLGRRGVNRWMQRSGIYVSASRYEPFGLAPLEAALHRCRLVLSDIGSHRELWDGCAEFFPSGDAAALASVLQDIFEIPAHRHATPERAVQRAVRRYGLEGMADAYVTAYAELANRPLSELRRDAALEAH
ncbi:MAG: glycosyltransferase family 4 protein [Gemmatimonadota bacterium]